MQQILVTKYSNFVFRLQWTETFRFWLLATFWGVNRKENKRDQKKTVFKNHSRPSTQVAMPFYLGQIFMNMVCSIGVRIL